MIGAHTHTHTHLWWEEVLAGIVVLDLRHPFQIPPVQLQQTYSTWNMVYSYTVRPHHKEIILQSKHNKVRFIHPTCTVRVPLNGLLHLVKNGLVEVDGYIVITRARWKIHDRFTLQLDTSLLESEGWSIRRRNIKTAQSLYWCALLRKS